MDCTYVGHGAAGVLFERASPDTIAGQLAEFGTAGVGGIISECAELLTCGVLAGWHGFAGGRRGRLVELKYMYVAVTLLVFRASSASVEDLSCSSYAEARCLTVDRA